MLKTYFTLGKIMENEQQGFTMGTPLKDINNEKIMAQKCVAPLFTEVVHRNGRQVSVGNFSKKKENKFFMAKSVPVCAGNESCFSTEFWLYQPPTGVLDAKDYILSYVWN